ncbi:MAG: hypothetical protein HOD43_13205 [Candidatus Marinimicrobia bacterium]|nr:hypothetical protein [Candidatus Neomarinimicrobiota bacterium]MBT3631903.1 hypothetical protein [Candidatus Neomarinimicrobiota bacterium]MBT3824462.1 hypothetical protein [Candidatus Neomarinimicrobiota bacterium]MBT4296752.1 hypothetical protein [Candidatus Neomarinimicrobiota bacterium]MBT4992091.1 hypothetical protein [Candidatus Neomarinimicrobiota bacterium]
MKIKYLALILAASSGLLAKDIVVVDTQILLGDVSTPYFFPVYTSDGESILITQNAYSGLWIINRSTRELSQITSSQGAGFQPRSLGDGAIIYRHDEYVKGRKFTSLHKVDPAGKQLIAEAARFVSPANMVNDRLIYLVDKMPTILNGVSGQSEGNLEDYTTVLNDKLTLRLFQAGTESVIAPQGEGNYIWAEVSPTQDMLVYTKTGRGTYVCDLKGNIISELGYAHAPQWSPNGEYLVYMNDLDDGNQYTASEIWIVSYDAKHSWKITDTPDKIEMYPQWSPNGERVIYHTLNGEIVETTITIVE